MRESTVAKGYWIPRIDVSDPEGYKAYMAATQGGSTPGGGGGGGGSTGGGC